MKKYIPKCKMCGHKLGQLIEPTKEESFIICSGDYIDDWSYCKSCMIEHCVTTNCFGCKFNPGNYNDCRFLKMKKNYMED